MLLKKRLNIALKSSMLALALCAGSAVSDPLIQIDTSAKAEGSKLTQFFDSLGYSFDGVSSNGSILPDGSQSIPQLVSLLTPEGIARSISRIEIPLTWESYEIKKGQNLSVIFKKAGIEYGELLKILNGEDEARDLGRIYAGEVIKFGKDADGSLGKIELERDGLESLIIEKTPEGYSGKTIVYEPEIRHKFAQGTIDRSLAHTGRKAGLANKTVLDLASIFAWDIDFAKNIQKGDQFQIVYEELYRNGKKVGVGDVLSAKFVNKGRTYEAVLYTDAEGSSDYFTPEGKSLRKAFLRSPVDFARISSHFNLKRRHPVLHTIRAHKGTDYAAGYGTPIRASGDGKVIRASVYGGYGNVVIIQHGGQTTTLYAHMQKFAQGIYSGKRVKQGDVIGYVGSSGLATGPHLHYEFRIKGQPQDPVNVELADADPVNASEMSRFKLQTQPLMLALETKSHGRPTSLAKMDD